MAGSITPAEALPRITVPTLILKADAPPESRAADLAAATALRNGKLVHLDGARHNLHHDKRAQTVQLISEFLDGFQTDLASWCGQLRQMSVVSFAANYS